ncbi:putative BAG family molecular chaperone regulator/7/8 [Helianthus anomalus]
MTSSANLHKPANNPISFIAFANSVENKKWKKKQLSPQDATMLIQRKLRAYQIRKSRVLCALRESGIVKGKLKELMALLNDSSFRHRVARDANERHKFSEKIIVLFLTLDAIEGANIMARAVKRSMVDDLEAMLDIVDPQPRGGNSLSLNMRIIDMLAGVIQKEVVEGVAEVCPKSIINTTLMVTMVLHISVMSLTSNSSSKTTTLRVWS